MEVFLIKTISIKDYNGDFGVEWNSNTDGLFFSLDTAKQVVDNNWGDISEMGSNEYVVILRTSGGVYPIVNEMGWYWWNNQTKSYQPCDRPEFTDRYCLTL